MDWQTDLVHLNLNYTTSPVGIQTRSYVTSPASPDTVKHTELSQTGFELAAANLN